IDEDDGEAIVGVAPDDARDVDATARKLLANPPAVLVAAGNADVFAPQTEARAGGNRRRGLSAAQHMSIRDPHLPERSPRLRSARQHVHEVNGVFADAYDIPGHGRRV